MKKILTIVLLCMAAQIVSGFHVPMKDRSSTKGVKIKAEKFSDGVRVREWDKEKRFWATYYRRTLRLSAYGDNRNREDVTVSCNMYLIGKNRQGLYQLLKAESTSATLKKFSKKAPIHVVHYTYHDWVSGTLSKNQFEYKGVCIIVKGPDGKIIAVEGEYDQFYKFIESKGEKSTFNSKGEDKEPRRTGQ